MIILKSRRHYCRRGVATDDLEDFFGIILYSFLYLFFLRFLHINAKSAATKLQSDELKHPPCYLRITRFASSLVKMHTKTKQSVTFVTFTATLIMHFFSTTNSKLPKAHLLFMYCTNM